MHKEYSIKRCFATAAFGKQYRTLAKLLATDLESHAKNYRLVIVTDQPKDFKGYSNITAIKHWCRGVQSYHERRFAIYHALSYSDTVIYLDADVRICASIPDELKFLPGLTARSGCSMAKHIQKHTPHKRKKEIIEKMADRVGVKLNSPDLKFINEFLFVVKVDRGIELEFLRVWGELAIYADILGLHKHPTYAMSLAAVKTNFSVFFSEMKGFDFFDDRIEKVRIQKGMSEQDAKAQYFQEQYEIEKADRTVLKRLKNKLYQPVTNFYHLKRVQLTAAINPSKLINY